MKQNFLGIEQQKGQPNLLSGKLVAYALVNETPKESPEGGLPLHDIIQNGILAVVGDYTEEKSLKEFIKNLKAKKPINTEEAQEESHEIAELLNDLTDDDFDQDMSEEQILGKLEEMTHVEVIPVPARIEHFASVEELLEQDADIFFLGHFANPYNAQLSTTTFPIMYQSAYKEQESKKLDAEIDGILSDVEQSAPEVSLEPFKELDKQASENQRHLSPEDQNALIQEVRQTFIQSSYEKFDGDLSTFLRDKFIPYSVYYSEFSEAEFSIFRRFMDEYPFSEDLDRLENILSLEIDLQEPHQREIELLCEKFAALKAEAFEKLEGIQTELNQI